MPQITPEQAAKFKQLFQDYEEAVSHAGTMLRAYGMESRQFHEAENAATLVWTQLKEMLLGIEKEGTG